MRVLQLISSAGFFGAESVLVELATALARRGHEVTVGAFDNLHARNLDLAEIARGRGLKTDVFVCRGRVDLRAAMALRNYVRRNRFDVVHSHGYKSNIYALLAGLGRDVRLVSTCHNWIDASKKMRWYGSIDRLVLRHFDVVVPVSRTVHATLVADGFREKQLQIVENGIDVEPYKQPSPRAAMRKALGIHPDAIVLGTVGRLSREKAQANLLYAASLGLLKRAGANARVLIVGDGPERAALEKAAREAGITAQTIFTGRRKDIPQVLQAMDLFVLPSLVEAQPMALLEAMAAGVPVVATTVGDVPHILAFGDRGTLVRPGDVPELTRALDQWLDRRDDARRHADKARTHVLGARSASQMAVNYESVYRTGNDAPASTG